MMWFLAVVFMVKTNQCVREVNILNSFMFSDQKKKKKKERKKKKEVNSLMKSCLSFSTVDILNVSSVNNLESTVGLQHRVQTLKSILKDKKKKSANLCPSFFLFPDDILI